MSALTPYKQTFEADLDALGATADGEVILGKSAIAGTVTAAELLPNATQNGAATDNRTWTVYNRKGDGTGTTVVTTFTNSANDTAHNLTAYKSKTLTLTSTAADLVVAVGDVLTVKSAHNGTGGIADVGGKVRVTVTRS